MVKPSQTVVVDFPTSRFDTGALTDGDSTPTGTFSRNGTDDGTVTVTVTKVSTGRYKASFTIPAGAGAGDSVDLWIAATVNSVAGGNAVWHDIVDTKRVSDLNDSAYAGGAVASVAGDVGGKVLGGGAGTISAVGVEAQVVSYATGQDPGTLIGAHTTGDTYTYDQAMRLMMAALAGVLSGAATTTITMKAAGGTAVRISATVDADGNRTALTLTP